MTQWIISSSVLILVIIGLRFLLRKRIKPLFQYALWALVLVRLLVPLQFGSASISLENAVENAPLVQEMEAAEQITHFDYHLDGFATGYYIFSPDLDHDPESGIHNAPVPERFTHAEADRITHLRTAKQYLTSLWVGGMIVMGVAFFLSNLVFALRLKKSRTLLEQGRLPVYVTEAVETPCYFGLVHPVIYLPPAVAADETQRTYAIAHETTHHRHGDDLWAALRCVCLVVHWYNPLVWLAAILSREDCEIACDEATITTLGEQHRGNYGRVLVALTCRKRTDLLRAATTMTGSAIGLKDRIKMIVKKPKTAIYALITVILVAAVAVGCTFTGGSKAQDTTDPTEITDPTDNTNPSEPEKTDYLQSIYGTPLTEAELSYFTELFAHTGTAEKEEEINWYNLILTCGWDHGTGRTGFTVPENVNLATLFNNGFRAISNVDNWTAEELAFIQGFYPGYPENWGDLNRLPAEKMNRVLQDYFGITLDKTNKVWLDKMHYFADTNCYFGAPAGATGEQKVNMLAGKKTEAGTVYLICTTNTSKMLDRTLLIALQPAPEGAAKPYLVRMCTQIKQAQDVAAAIQTTIHLPSEEELNATGTQNSKYFLLCYLPNSEIMDGGYDGNPYTTEGMVMDFLYAIDDGVTYPISGGTVSSWAKDLVNGYVYFVREDAPQKIWRTDLHGQNATVFYQSQYGDITFLSCANGWLSIAENYNRASLFDTKTGKLTVLLKAYKIEQFSYDAKHLRVFWRGKLNKSDSSGDWYSGDNSYYYYLKTNEYLMLQSGTTGIPVTPTETTPPETTEPEPTACRHSFSDATCTAPKTCSKCGETEGSTIDHTYSQATCLTPQTCTVCGATHGSTSDHTWYGATCLQEGICTVCGIIGEKGKHNYVATDPASSSGNFACSVCGIARRQVSTDYYVYDLNEIAEAIANYAKQKGFQVVVEGVLSADYTSRYIYLSMADIYRQGPAYLTGLGIDLVNTAYANYAQSPLGIGAYTLHIEVDTVLNSVYGAGLGVQIAVTS